MGLAQGLFRQFARGNVLEHGEVRLLAGELDDVGREQDRHPRAGFRAELGLEVFDDPLLPYEPEIPCQILLPAPEIRREQSRGVLLGHSEHGGSAPVDEQDACILEGNHDGGELRIIDQETIPRIARPQGLLRPLALGDVEDERGDMLFRAGQQGVGEEDGDSGAVPPDIFLFVRSGHSALAQLFDRPLIGGQPFGRRDRPPVDPALFELLARIADQAQIVIVGLDDASRRGGDDDADDVGVDKAAEVLEGPAQGLFRPLAVGDVPPETVVNGFSRAFGELGRHLDIPDFPQSRAMQGFEVIPAGAHDGRDVPANLGGGFGGLDIRELQPGELFPGIPQLPASRVVELQGPRRGRVEDDDSVRRILE